MNIQGTLIPIGGNEDKGIETSESYNLEYVHDGILSRILKESGGKEATVVIVTTASGIPKEIGQVYLEAFGKLGCKDIHVLDIRSKKQADEQDNLELMSHADCVMFSGGNQSKITKYIGGTKLHKLILGRYKNSRFVIAGTSAGAMCMSREMITGGSSREALLKGAVLMGKGMNFIPELIIDSHFIRRGRFGRLAEAVARFPELIGVGLAEDTGLVIKNGKDCEVIGSGMIILFNPRELEYNNEKILPAGTPMSLTNLKTHVLTAHDLFTVTEAGVDILPHYVPATGT